MSKAAEEIETARRAYAAALDAGTPGERARARFALFEAVLKAKEDRNARPAHH